MSTKTKTAANAGFILSEGDGSISRETVTLILGQNCAAGTVLAKTQHLGNTRSLPRLVHLVPK